LLTASTLASVKLLCPQADRGYSLAMATTLANVLRFRKKRITYEKGTTSCEKIQKISNTRGDY